MRGFGRIASETFLLLFARWNRVVRRFVVCCVYILFTSHVLTKERDSRIFSITFNGARSSKNMFLRLVVQEKYFCVRRRAENGPIATIVRGRSSTTLLSRLRANNRKSLFLIVFRINEFYYLFLHFTLYFRVIRSSRKYIDLNYRLSLFSFVKKRKEKRKEHAVKLLDKVPTYPISGRKRTILKLPNNR